MKKDPRQKRQQRRGAMAIMALVMMTVIATFIGLAIDTNWLMLGTIQSQACADLAAKSALLECVTNTNEGERERQARGLATTILNDTEIVGRQRAIVGGRVRFGYLENPHELNPRFVESSERISSAWIESPYARKNVRVDLFFGQIWGMKSVDIACQAKSNVQTVDIILCLDASRSMNRSPLGGNGSIHVPPTFGSRWFIVIDTVKEFLSALQSVNPNARVGLVTFGGGNSHPLVSPLDSTFARKEVPLSKSSQWPAIVQQLESYNSYPRLGIGTSLYDGIDMSVDLHLDAIGDQDRQKIILFLSDGLQVAPRPSPSIAVERARSNGIVMHTVSFGSKKDKLEKLADITDGQNLDAFDEKELKEAFRKLLGKFTVRLAD